MNKKVIFFDIDGTIFSNTNYQVSERTRTAIQSAQKNGHLAFINTGRTYAEINQEILDIGFDGCICGCGTYISYKNKVLFEITIANNIIKEVIKDLRRLNIYAVLEGSRTLYADFENGGPFNEELRKLHFFDEFPVSSWDSPVIACDKFTIWSKTRDSFLQFFEQYKDTFDFIEWDEHLCEVVPKGHSKATGIRYLISHLGIPKENTFAMGDGFNDLPMLEYVKYSIGMGNAPDEVKEIVSYVTKDVDEEGVAHALKHFDLI